MRETDRRILSELLSFQSVNKAEKTLLIRIEKRHYTGYFCLGENRLKVICLCGVLKL
jgi:hypothetical protein